MQVLKKLLRPSVRCFRIRRSVCFLNFSERWRLSFSVQRASSSSSAMKPANGLSPRFLQTWPRTLMVPSRSCFAYLHVLRFQCLSPTSGGAHCFGVRVRTSLVGNPAQALDDRRPCRLRHRFGTGVWIYAILSLALSPSLPPYLPSPPSLPSPSPLPARSDTGVMGAELTDSLSQKGCAPPTGL